MADPQELMICILKLEETGTVAAVEVGPEVPFLMSAEHRRQRFSHFVKVTWGRTCYVKVPVGFS